MNHPAADASVEGLAVRSGSSGATFRPVWGSLPDPRKFLRPSKAKAAWPLSWLPCEITALHPRTETVP